MNDLLQVANLRRRQVVVEDDHVGLVGLGPLGDLLGLARTDVETRMDFAPLGHDFIDHLRPSRAGQAA